MQGNFIGTDVTGTKALGNGGGDGVQIQNGNFNGPGVGVTIGGALAGEGNVISNNRVGIFILRGSENVIQGNRIGTDVTGTLDFGNSLDGIVVASSRNLIGGAAPGAGNLVSGNNRAGIRIDTVRAGENVIRGNRIGTQADGTSPLGNGADGIVAADFLSNTTGTGLFDNLIGGLGSGDGNVITFNAGPGVNVLAARRLGILSNSIFSNGKLGIDLNGNGPTPNDAGDADTGDNELQNFPVLTAAVSDGTQTKVEGTVFTLPIPPFSSNSSPARLPTRPGLARARRCWLPFP